MFTDHQMYHNCPVQPLSTTMERNWKTNLEIAPNCPRCASPNTKFCYYNNYSLSQPRYFCKGCRRYWTKGGSLRNVPVGGGCRKNRRARSARLSQNGRVLDNSSKNFDDQISSDSDSVVQSGGGTNGPDIDLAVVFANFVKDDSCRDFQQSVEFVTHDTGSVIEMSNSLTPDSVQSDAMVECQKPRSSGTNLHQVFDTKQQEDGDRIKDLLENDMNAFGLQTWLNDEAVQDVLSTDSSAAALTNFTWQPMLQFHDLDFFPEEHEYDQLNTSASLIADNWTSFDLSGFEIYSRP
ncbi:hypothetical protein LWI28_007881 [Acer negundo]|uniref:Dof zinc finger protein n=1 Tax=Acer negundo TaxID=4023 RepID=A0AAD5JIQ9_ACENE|nr:hypothetical protein LWI28_007881 [Acer negundo]KAK4859153.1 hypothetical protein QYF36_000399 [Acer negundo]